MFFKKKASNKLVAAEAAASQIAEKVEKNFTVFTMPKRFLGKQIDAKQAKTTGVIILVFGFIFLLAALGFVYYYFIIRPANLINNSIAKINNISSSSVATNISNNANSAVSAENKMPSSAIIPETTMPLPAGTSTSESVNNIVNNTNAATTTNGQNDDGVATTSVIVPIKIIATYAPDTDNDGLTDLEETIFGADLNKTDSDGDSYGDLAEVQNLYNPAGPGKILANSNFDIYSNSTFGYSLYYPKLWKINDSAGGNSVVFAIDDKQIISVAEQDNTSKQSVEDWYKQQMGVNYIAPTQILNKKNWTGVTSDDGLNIYLLNPLGDKIFIFSYNLGDSGLVKYRKIFDMMINSLK